MAACNSLSIFSMPSQQAQTYSHGHPYCCVHVRSCTRQIPRCPTLPDRPLTSSNGCCRSSMPCVKACCMPSATIWTASSALMLMTWTQWTLVSCTSQMHPHPPPNLKTRPACSLLTSATPYLSSCPEFCTIGTCAALLLQCLMIGYCPYTCCLTFCIEVCTIGSCDALLQLPCLMLGCCTFTCRLPSAQRPAP